MRIPAGYGTKGAVTLERPGSADTQRRTGHGAGPTMLFAEDTLGSPSGWAAGSMAYQMPETTLTATQRMNFGPMIVLLPEQALPNMPDGYGGILNRQGCHEVTPSWP